MAIMASYDYLWVRMMDYSEWNEFEWTTTKDSLFYVCFLGLLMIVFLLCGVFEWWHCGELTRIIANQRELTPFFNAK